MGFKTGENSKHSHYGQKLLIALFFFSYLFIGCSTTVTQGDVNTITAASPSLEDVQAAVNSASDGDTVIIPAASGSVAWTNQLVIMKFISLIGPGASSLTIRWGGSQAPGDTSPADFMINWQLSDPSLDLPWGMSGLTLNFNYLVPGLWLHQTSTTPVTKLRIHDCTFTNPLPGGSNSGRTSLLEGNIYGVIDSNTINDGCFAVYGLNTNWQYLTFQYGTANNLYIEDNVITNRGSFIGGGVGGRYCCRHNTITTLGNNIQQVFEYHGNDAPNQNTGGMGVEIYNNNIIYTAGTDNGLQWPDRGGMWLLFNNTMSAGYSNSGMIPYLREEYIDCIYPYPFSSDGESQHICRSYYWNNTIGGALATPTIGQTLDYGVAQVVGGVSYGPMTPYRVVPQWDLDCWKQVSSFNGTTGMGVGTLANRPATCTLDQCGYWATDTNTLYRWHNASGGYWEAYYTPYTYPHPLRKGD